MKFEMVDFSDHEDMSTCRKKNFNGVQTIYVSDIYSTITTNEVLSNKSKSLALKK